MKNYFFFFLSSIWEGRAVGKSLISGGGGRGQAVIEGLTMAQVLLLFLPKSEGGIRLPPWFPTALVGVWRTKKIGTKTVIGFLLVSSHIFKKVIRRHFLIGFFWPQVGQSYLFGTFDVCLFVCFHPLDFFSICWKHVLSGFFQWRSVFLYWLIVCVCETFFHFFFFLQRFFSKSEK